MLINRRDLCQGAAAVAIAAALGTSILAPFAAAAETVDMAALMKPPALPDIVLGKADAPVTIVEYASMTCPHCAHFAETTFPELKKRYIDTGKVRFIFREFPLDALALDGAMLARCAANGDPNRFIGVVDALFQQQEKWAKPYQRGESHPGLKNAELLALAKQVGFTEASYKECLANQDIQKGIITGLQTAGDQFKVNSTPTLFVNGELHPGALKIEELEKIMEPYLKGK